MTTSKEILIKYNSEDFVKIPTLLKKGSYKLPFMEFWHKIHGFEKNGSSMKFKVFDRQFKYDFSTNQT